MRRIGWYFKNVSFILLLICLFALFIRIYLFTAFRLWDEQVVQDKVIVGDAAGYNVLALGILDTRTFSDFGAFRTPIYPLFIAFIYFLFGIKPWIVLLLQLFLDTGIAIIVYFIAKEIFESKPIAFISAFLYSISFPSAYYSTRLLTEVPFTFVFTLAILIFIKGLKKKRLLDFALTGIFIGLATLTRPIAYYFPLVLLIVLTFSDSRAVQKLRNMVIMIIAFLIVVSVWQIRNLHVYGYYALTQQQGGNLLAINAAVTKADVEGISRVEARDKLIGHSLQGVTNLFKKSEICRKIAISYILQHPLVYIKCSFKGTVRMFLGMGRAGMSELLGITTEPPVITESLSYSASRIIENFYYELPIILLSIKQTIEYLFVFLGIIIMYFKDKKIFLLLLIMATLYFVVLTGPLGNSRYRVPIIPFYLIIGAKGIFETFRFANTKRKIHHILSRNA